MPRPARFTVDQLLDAAAAIVAADGAAAVTVSAVARAVDAPSGSMYHRFPSRAALCGELWMRTEERFQNGLIAVLERSGERQDRVAAGALYTVQWCRDHADEAQVLLAGPDAFCRIEWPTVLEDRRKTLHRRMIRQLRDMGGPVDRVTAALVDIPSAVVRRHLAARSRVPATADGIVVDCARALVPRE
ncbi:TetR family transcriptional regulator [Mycobacterium manitobense]|uniref:TetR family transcriptional regulator n=1 Tax=[Mycobacterium] manitobense TaxID=190147 RepID=A0A9X2YCW6_9MYCO|nr:TetR family transcriptional regulator [[Mycobacterium] manitobense]MCV7172298.1 TetR family transcriptional regulator [[Mycobacterium] manitobense]